ncbi:uroporphyrinogen decarboxylase [Bacillus thuringiensis]|uniref:uroporphyrinogen decarboxylase n=1 Tax=Bacillus thuringiensis TaxID=1428 RepID=UPI000D03C70D|nr:uroporphyrinogen decarboxylase [Bacillus thuringiensis]PRT04324.1 uroporphyrinogen decarboxylase [Bacillus thuringiensis]
MPFKNDFLRACQGLDTSRIPVWFMRQAGRYQPEFRKILEKYSLFEITHRPELCALVTKLPVEQLNVDAAILFADIMTPLPALGIDVDIVSGIGPVINNPIRTANDVLKIGSIDPQKDVPYILDTIKLLRQDLNVPLIVFSGAPFTLACYIIEGKTSNDYYKTKGFMYSQPRAWEELMHKLSNMIIAYITAQVESGAQVVQIFDTWVGSLNLQDYQVFVSPYMKKVSEELSRLEVPIILFGVGSSHLLEEWKALPIDVIGLDWRISITEARNKGINKVLQGNLDPSLLLAPWKTIEPKVKDILDMGTKQGNFIFNLGHGVLPEVKVETLQRLTNFVHEYSVK